MYNSTGISLQELLVEQGMLSPHSEEDAVLISSETYGMDVEGMDRPATEVIPELADPDWVRQERLVGKVSFRLFRLLHAFVKGSLAFRRIARCRHTCLRETFEYLENRSLVCTSMLIDKSLGLFIR